MLFYNFFASKLNTTIDIVLKNDLEITGTLVSVDPYLNIKLESPKVINPQLFPGLVKLKTCSIRGSSIKHALIPFDDATATSLNAASRYRFMTK